MNGTTLPHLIVQGHHDDALHALTCHPTRSIFATGGDDCTLR